MRQRPAPSRPVTVVLLLTAAVFLYVSLPNLGTAIRAARGDGTRGMFTAARLDCVRHPGHESCAWSGTFRPQGGGQARFVTFEGGGRDGLRPGESRPAVDIGLPTQVYAPRSSGTWILTAALLIAGYAILAYLARAHLMPPRKPPGSRDRPGAPLHQRVRDTPFTPSSET